MESASRRVLVVDDNENAANMVVLLLSVLGHVAKSARDGETALRLAQTLQPEIVLLDISMPGMDGYEVARLLRQSSGKVVRIVALTGHGKEAVSANSGAEHFDVIIEKPASMKNLRLLLE